MMRCKNCLSVLKYRHGEWLHDRPLELEGDGNWWTSFESDNTDGKICSLLTLQNVGIYDDEMYDMP